MPRTSRRTGSAAVNSPAASDIFRSATNRAISKELERIDVLFHSYSDSSSGVIGPEGIESLCSDVGVEHTDIRMLMLAWKLRAERQGYFTLEEWRGGLKALRSDSIGKLKKALTELEKEVRSPENFSDFYSYAFRYCLTEDKQRSIDIESTCELLDLILGPIYRPQIGKLTEFLKGQSDYKVINMDQWMGFLRFCKEINFPSVDNYDPALAWPLILDNFVEWMQQQQHGR
ncbi:unnamed protein product [Spirodela intermedia]|uniref:Defective in cullin neddylation protein n=1 Tax=Spirodela intermedia TaxID=51605 RepID=A0A7I8LBA6_SPIIN|nr:unnamed protein product [Spirodela intermedia]